MKKPVIVSGFSRLSREEKLAWLQEQELIGVESLQILESHLHPDPGLRERYASFSENSISTFPLPLGLAPNFLINGDLYCLPMVIEESSVVAAASHAAKFWAMNGGFMCRVIDTIKVGQVHFNCKAEPAWLEDFFGRNRDGLLAGVGQITAAMEKRGGGIVSMELRQSAEALPGAWQLFVRFRTADAMGANFINTVLEALSARWEALLLEAGDIQVERGMAILSNYTPECLVNCRLSAHIEAFNKLGLNMDAGEFARRFVSAVDIACHDPYRAVTHNKGIMNGVDALVLATGNDFRAVEAGAHAYASRKGQYSSLSRAWIEADMFHFELEIPLALGTVGGLTSGHPLAATALEILGRPDAGKLMMIAAAAGLANNFSAVRSLVSTGIQAGHMKMHLGNILHHFSATARETEAAREWFRERPVSHAAVGAFLKSLRKEGYA